MTIPNNGIQQDTHNTAISQPFFVKTIVNEVMPMMAQLREQMKDGRFPIYYGCPYLFFAGVMTF